MRRTMLALAFFLVVMFPIQPRDAELSSELETLNAKWFQAFDSWNAAMMDEMEAPNLALILHDGTIWLKDQPRTAMKMPSGPPPDVHHSFNGVNVRRFGDTAVLTGTVVRSSSKEGTRKDALTVVFVKIDGQWKIVSGQFTPIENK